MELKKGGVLALYEVVILTALALTWVEYAASLYVEDSLQEKQAEKSKAVVHHRKPFHRARPVVPN